MIGKTLGYYEIVSQLGKGGMGEVYRAHDTKLNRDVALKVLPAEFANDAERMGRFKREAQLLASLNHTNIAAIYGLEESEGVHALVMELAEGPTLADRINRGPVPLDEALSIARQIAEALEAAHEKGIIHRDLKPANIKVTPEGAVKVLDFGLAKALEGEAAGADASESPTLSLAATKAGVILGTAAYMSPEQARGSAVDKRCDIWSFGVVLFEMLTGKQLFAGETISDTLAAVLRADVDWSMLPPNIPAGIRALLRRCLNKDRKQRLQAIGEARIVIEEHLANPAGSSVHEPASGSHNLREKLAWGAAIVGLAGALVLGALYFSKTPAEAPETRLEVNTPATSEPTSLAISPDGWHLVFVGLAEGKQQLWLRPLNQTKAQPLAGTEGATYPFWSPDNKSIGFFADGKLKRINIAGGQLQVLASVLFGGGGTWNRDGIIVFGSAGSLLYRVSASGGDPVAIRHPDRPRQTNCFFPQFLPDGRHLLYYAWGAASGIYLASLDSAESTRLLTAQPPAIYASPGYLLFMRQGLLVAQRFDLARGKLDGDPVPIADSVAQDPTYDIGGFSSSGTGMLAYRTGGTNRRRLAWFDRSGKEIGEMLPPDENSPQDLQLSPYGHRVALSRTVQGNQDIWLIDASRGVPKRFTFGAGADHAPVWSSDGSRIAFYSEQKGRPSGIYQKASSGAGNEELLGGVYLEEPSSWSPDGRFLLYSHHNDPKTPQANLWVLPLFGDRKPVQFSNTSFTEYWGQFSPDGRWIAYASDESGIYEVYVQPFPGPRGKWQISTGGGIEPRWRSNGKELFFISPDGRLMAAPIQSSGQMLEAGSPVALFQTRIVGGGNFFLPQQYAVAPDGRRFLINILADEPVASPITIVTNWARALKK